MTWTALIAAVASACLACGGTAAQQSAYDGTVIVGTDYVQVLTTAPRHRGCPPRIHRAGTCVRTDGTCAAQPACVTRLTVSTPSGDVLADAAGTFVRVEEFPDTIVVAMRGCGGALATALELGATVAPFESATARVGATGLIVEWQPSSDAGLVCALATSAGVRELCCEADTGSATLPMTKPAAITGARLSRGVLLARRRTRGGTVEYYRTAETGELLASPAVD